MPRPDGTRNHAYDAARRSDERRNRLATLYATSDEPAQAAFTALPGS